MDNIEKMVKLTILYDIYKSLLTDKQKSYFEAYYFKNQSLGEIAEKYEISRNAVYSQLNVIEENLLDYEAKLHLKRKIDKKNQLVEELKTKEPSEEMLEIIKKLEEI